MKELSSHQFILLSLFLLLSTKILTFQPLVFSYAQKDSFWSILLGAVVDILILLFVVLFMQKHKDTTFYTLLKESFGKVIAKIILIVMFVIILLKIIFLAEETFSFFIKFLYEDLNLIVYIIPIAFVCGYFAVKGITTIARTTEIFYFFVLFGIVICALTAIGGINFDHILPCFENGLSQTFNGLVPQIFYRGNGLILLCFMGKVDFAKHFTLKFMSAKIFATILLLGVTLLFFLVYGPSTKYVEFALADIPQYDPFVSDLGRFGWLSVVVCIIALILTTSTMLYCMSLIIRWTFNLKRSFVSTSISIVFILFLGFINGFSLIVMEEKIVGIWMYVVGFSMLLIFAILVTLFWRRKNGQSVQI